MKWLQFQDQKSCHTVECFSKFTNKCVKILNSQFVHFKKKFCTVPCHKSSLKLVPLCSDSICFFTGLFPEIIHSHFWSHSSKSVSGQCPHWAPKVVDILSKPSQAEVITFQKLIFPAFFKNSSFFSKQFARKSHQCANYKNWPNSSHSAWGLLAPGPLVTAEFSVFDKWTRFGQ